MYVITLDNGEVVKCTKNHPFMTRWHRDTRYIKAENLKVGMSFRPIQFKKCKITDFCKEYELVKKSEINHKIVKIDVVKLEKPVEFYDITVDKYENFAIGQGIFVHNSSIYGSLVQLCNCGLSDYNGNFGTDIGLREEPPAAMRYTEVRMSEEIVQMAFQHLDFVPFEALEMPIPEPVYLASKLPFCLLRGKNYSVGIGFAYRTFMPSYTKVDLVKRLKWLLGDKKDPEPIIKPVADCILDNSDEVYKQLLTTGNAKLMYKGKVEYDKVNKKIIIYSKCPTKKWKSVLSKFKDEIEVQKSIGYIDESSGSQTKITFIALKRGQNLEKIYKKIHELVSGYVSFQCNMCDRIGNVAVVSIDQMLLRAYVVYKDANKKLLEFNIQKCQQIIDELTLVDKVKKVLPKWLKEYPDDINKLIDGVEQDTSIKRDILNEMFEKYTIPRFTRCKTDTTEKQKLKMQIEENLRNLDNFVWRLYEKL